MFESAANKSAEYAGQTDSDFLVVSGPVGFEMQDLVSSRIKERKEKKKNLTVLLCTPGGSADASYRISRAFQDNYTTVRAFIVGWCKSAGTLCVIGANELVMTDESELGPLDVQISKRDEIGERDSGLVVSEALRSLETQAFTTFENILLHIKERSDGTVSFKMAAEIAATLAGSLFEPIYRQIDPEKLGATARSLTVANEYGKRLNVKGKNLKSNALQLLGVGYPSHGFVIDRREAERLFHKVRKPTELELEIASEVGVYASIPSEQALVQFLNPVGKEVKDESTGTPTDGTTPKSALSKGTKAAARKRSPRAARNPEQPTS